MSKNKQKKHTKKEEKIKESSANTEEIAKDEIAKDDTEIKDDFLSDTSEEIPEIIPIVYLSTGNADIDVSPKLRFDFPGMISYIKNSTQNRKRRTPARTSRSSDRARELRELDLQAKKYTKREKHEPKDPKNKKLGAILIAAAAVIIFSLIIWSAVKSNAQEVYVDDTLVGIIKNTDITSDELYDTAVAKLKSETGTNIEVNEHVNLKPVHASDDEVVTEDYVLKEICDHMTYKAEATAIYVNGEQVAVVSSEDEAKEILREVAKRCLELDDSQEAPEDPQFVQEVATHSKFVSSDELMPKQKVIDILSADTTENKTYTVQDGDTLFYIAGKFEISTDDLIKANPSIGDGSNITVGQTLRLVVPVPFLSVKTTEEISYKETVAREVKQIQNPEEYLTYSNVITEGSDGEKEVTAKITKVNGVETSREIINEKITVEPVTQEVEVGTMETPPKRALGNFIYPVQGSLSSGYGARWGTFHHGIDLAAPYGMPVYASDGGTVVFAGYDNGGYGNLVVIDHGNGYTTKYAHNSSVAVEVGQQVAQGELVAYVGSTGDSTGNHCHFEVLVNGQSQDPFEYLG